MARSTCPKCSASRFEVSEQEPAHSNFKLMFVQCASCGAVVGTLDYFNIGNMLAQQNEAIKRIAERLEVPVKL